MRKLEIRIYPKCEWHISCEGARNQKKYFKFETELIFPAQVATDDGKIAWIFETFLDKKTLELAKKEPLMREVCEFSCELDGEKYEFEGDFVAAFAFVYSKF